MMKKRIFLIAIAICCFALCGAGTLAYFTARETAYNVITTGELAMDLVETTTDGLPFPEEGIDGLTPGDVVDKVVTVQNVGGVDFYTRVKLTCTVTDAQGKTDTLGMENITLDIDTEHWTLGEDGYYYYYRSLAPRGPEGGIDETEPLFTTVTFSTELGNEYQNAKVEIVVDAQAVQSRNNTDSPLTAAGWDAE